MSIAPGLRLGSYEINAAIGAGGKGQVYRATHTACEYLAAQCLIGKVGAPVQLTKKSNAQVQELASFHLARESGRHGR